MQDVLSTLNLVDVEVINERAEVVCHMPKYFGKYDVVIARAVTHLVTLFRWTNRFLKPGGSILAIKARRGLKELTRTNCDNMDITIIPLQSKLIESQRNTVIVKMKSI